MRNQLDTRDKEISTMIKGMAEGITQELKLAIPHIDLARQIPDATIKEAILKISSGGMEKLFQRYGREVVLDFIRDFSQGRRW